jgi:hypothetical protein
MASLISKPGITNANTAISIPKDWSASWFKGLVSNLLQGADVRNAVGSSGIVVSGTIASPYATIGFAAPVTLPGLVTITAPLSGDSLDININLGQGIKVNVPTGAAGGFLSWRSNGTEVGFLGNGTNIGGANANDFGIGADLGNLILDNLGGGIKGRGPVAATLVDMTPDTGTYTGTLVGCTTSPTATVVWSRNGNQVTLYVPALSGTSNSTSLSITGSLPAALQPTRSQVIAAAASAITDGGAKVNDVSVSMGAGSSTITFLRGDSSAGFTNTATSKGVTRNFTFSYLLN